MGAKLPIGICMLVSVAGTSGMPLNASDIDVVADQVTAINPADFHTPGKNPWFPLVPGTTFTLVEKQGEKRWSNVITVTHQTKVIQGVKCVVVHDTVSRDGKLKEDTFDWFAVDHDGNVWYFGEESHHFRKNGSLVRTGSWQAGNYGARASLFMPAQPQLGTAFVQEDLPGERKGMSRVDALDETVSVPAGAFANTLRTSEWTSHESGHETKWYAKGVGFIRSESTDGEIVELVSVRGQR